MREKKCPSTVGFTQDAKPKLIFCGQWTCKHCAPRLSATWAKRARLHIFRASSATNGQFWFLTLTLGSQYRTPKAGFAALPKLWDRLRKCIQRVQGAFEYLAFVEGQPERSNMPHFHILMNCEPPAKRNKYGKITKHNLHDFAVLKGWGHQAELKPVTDDQAGWYVSKYATKQHEDTPKGFRRVRASKGWTKLPRHPHAALIVPSKTEDVGMFINRLSEQTGVSQEDCYQQYRAGQKMLARERQARNETDAIA